MLAACRRRRQHGKAAATGGGGSPPAPTGTATATFGLSVNTGSVSVPTGAVAGDTLLVAVFGSTIPTTPTGFSLVKSVNLAPSGGFLGMICYVFSKVLVAGDLGGSVSTSGMSASWPWDMIARSYTSGTISSSGSASSNAAGGSMAPALLTSSANNQTLISFIGVLHQGSSTTFDTLNTGGNDVTLLHNPGGNSTAAVEDWPLTTAGSTGSGGALNSTQTSPSFVSIAALLNPVGS